MSNYYPCCGQVYCTCHTFYNDIERHWWDKVLKKAMQEAKNWKDQQQYTQVVRNGIQCLNELLNE